MRQRLGVLFLALAFAVVPHDGLAEPTKRDSLDLYLHHLSDSTDVYFGPASTKFDTTGFDSLFTVASIRPLRSGEGLRAKPFPVLRYHRSEGAVVGAGIRMAPVAGGLLSGAGSYGFSNKEGRYSAGWRRTLWRRGELVEPPDPFAPGRIGEGTRLDFYTRYARETLPFMPEHAGADYGSSGALLSGANRQSVYQRRGVTAGFEAWTGDWRFRVGFRHALEQAMPLATRFSLLGKKASVPDNVLADHDEYSEGEAGVAFFRRDWDFAGLLDARDDGGDRWRLRGVLGKGFRLTEAFRSTFQVEAGAAAAHAPRQRRFEIGGARAVPSVPYGSEVGDHLLLAKAEVMYGRGLLETLGIGHPKWMVLQPFLFLQAGAAWNDPSGRDVIWSKPPSSAFRESTGLGLALRVAVPDRDTFARIYLAWPLGADAGVPRIRFAIRAPFDLIGRL